MKNVLIVTSGILPVPAVRGGAAEYLTQLYIDENENNKRFNFDVATIIRPEDEEVYPKYKNTKFIKIDETDTRFKFSRIIRYLLNKVQPFYYFDNAFAHELLKRMKQIGKKYDLIVVENNPLYVKTLRKYDKTVKIILHLHNDYLNSRTKHNKYIFDNCNKIYVVSDYIGNRTRTINNSDKIGTIYNGIDLDRFHIKLSPKQKNIIRKKYNLEEGDFVVLFVGRLNKGKGILELIKAFEAVERKHKNVKLLIVGKEMVERKGASRFEKKILRLANSMRDRIIFTGFVNYEDMPSIYGISDVSVTPSHWGEPLATTVLEGMASGISQIVTNDGGIPEEVFGTNICILDKDNLIIGLQNELEKLIDSPMKQVELNQEVASRRFDRKRYVRTILSSFKEALDG